jgi:hypothetical protein
MEVMDRYQPSFLFLNNFNNSGLGDAQKAPCQCPSCKSIYAQTHDGRTLPTDFSPEYLEFLRSQTSVTAEMIEVPVRQKYPSTVIMNANCEPSDGMQTESRMAFRQLFAYTTTEAVDRQLTSHPGKISLNITISYSNNYSRLLLMPPAETQVRMYQSMASGSHPCVALTGTFEQCDRDAVAAMMRAWGWHKRNSDLYVGQRNVARILLLCRPELKFRSRDPAADMSEKGLLQILSENHIAVASSDTEAPLDTRPGDFDVVVVSRGAPLKAVERFVRGGGKAIYVDQHPGYAVPAEVGAVPLNGTGYWRVHDRSRLPGFGNLDFLEAGGGPGDGTGPTKMGGKSLVQYPPEQNALLTLVPPRTEEPAEQAGLDQKETTIPGLIMRSVDAGQLAFLPWDLGGLYNRLYFHGHAELLMVLVRSFQPQAEIETDASSAVQMMLMRQDHEQRWLLHLINLSGQRQRGWSSPTTTGPIGIALKGNFGAVRSRALGIELPTQQEGGRSRFTLPHLEEFDSLVIA